MHLQTFRNNFFENTGPLHGDLQVIGCGHEICGDTYNVKRNNWSFFAIEYVIKGKGYFSWDNQTVELTKGMMFSYGVGTPHKYWADPKDPFEKIWIAFKGERLVSLVKDIMGNTTGVCSLHAHDKAHLLMMDCVEEMESIDVDTHEVVLNLLTVLLLKTRAKIHDQKVTDSNAHEMFRQCKRYVDQQFDTMRSPYELIQYFSISSSYLCRLFKRYCQRSPYEYMLSLKLNKAAHQLMTSNLSIKEIANSIQFADPLHFSRVFKHYFGRSPKAYRTIG